MIEVDFEDTWGWKIRDELKELGIAAIVQYALLHYIIWFNNIEDLHFYKVSGNTVVETMYI